MKGLTAITSRYYVLMNLLLFKLIDRYFLKQKQNVKFFVFDACKDMRDMP